MVGEIPGATGEESKANKPPLRADYGTPEWEADLIARAARIPQINEELAETATITQVEMSKEFVI